MIINFEYPPLGGGGGIATAQLAEELSTRHQVHVLTTCYGDLDRVQLINGVTVVRVPVIGRRSLPTASLLSLLSFVPMAVWQGVGLCRKNHFDVINAQFALPSGLVGVILAKCFGLPFVLSFIGGDVYDPSKGTSPHRYWIFRWLIRYLAGAATKRTAISRDTKMRVEQLHGVTQPISVIPIGLKVKKFSPSSREALGLPVGSPIAISVGRLIPRKGFEALIRAWKDIKEGLLVIIGDGPLKDELANLVRQLNLQERVKLLGFVSEDQKQRFLRAADVYVSAASHEGFGIVFLEAMEVGLPIVAINNGGHTDFLTDDRNAVLVPPDNDAIFVSVLRQILADENLRHRLGENNKKEVKNYYLENMVMRFEEILKQAHDEYARSH